MSLNWISKKGILLTSLIFLIGAGIYLISAFLLVDHSLSEDDTSNNDSNRAPLFEELPSRILSEDSQLLDTKIAHDILEYCWYLNDSMVDEDSSNYVYIPNQENNGNYTVKVEATVSDGIYKPGQTWYLDIFNGTLPFPINNFQMEVGVIQLTNTLQED